MACLLNMNIFSKIKQIFFVIDIPEVTRRLWIENEIKKLPEDTFLLDAGCGNQPYKEFYEHLKHATQDFAQYDGAGNGEGMQNGEEWGYGELDYTGNIWEIDEKDKTFDAVMCTEVIEHVPYPNETIAELSRLLKPGGKLILTAPFASLPHMQPYFFYPGFSADYYKYFCEKNGLKIIKLEQISNSYGYVFMELKRLHEILKPGFTKPLYYISFAVVAPVLKLLMLKCKDDTPVHQGYMLVAEKL